MSAQSPAVVAPVVTTPASTTRRGLFAVLADLLNRSAQAEAEANAAERYWTSVARGL